MNHYNAGEWYLDNNTENNINEKNFGINNLINNTKILFLDYFVFNYQSIFLVVFLIIGIIYFFYENFKFSIFFVFFIIIFYIIFFSSWLNEMGAGHRLIILFYPLFSIYIAYGIFAISKIIFKIISSNFKIFLNIKDIFINSCMILFVIILFVLSFDYIFNVRSLSYEYLETFLPRQIEKDVEKNAIIIYTNKEIIETTTNLKCVIDYKKEFFDNNIDNINIYFYEGMYGENWYPKDKMAFLKKEFIFKPYMRYSKDQTQFILYKLIKK
jgi:hypothetical protein